MFCLQMLLRKGSPFFEIFPDITEIFNTFHLNIKS
jgi:hypothetical protein